MATIGGYVRFLPGQELSVRDGLSAIRGVELFDLDRPGTVGVIIEAGSLDDAHGVLERDLRRVEGVTGCFPVYVNIEDESDIPRPSAGAPEMP
ncbi:MAG: hypothetical protein CMJ18_26645 [Phycisphaeraceae bacterium]|nr:hypothetical protein [Phycisphaeraceae bacterium]